MGTLSVKPTNKKYNLTPSEGGAVGCLLGAVGLPVIAFVLLILANIIFRVPLDGQFGMGIMALAPLGAIAGVVIGALCARKPQ